MLVPIVNIEPQGKWNGIDCSFIHLQDNRGFYVYTDSITYKEGKPYIGLIKTTLIKKGRWVYDIQGCDLSVCLSSKQEKRYGLL